MTEGVGIGKRIQKVKKSGPPENWRSTRSGGAPLTEPPDYSGSLGLLNNTVSLMLPCPNCGKLAAWRFPGSRLDAVSSGGKRISEFKKSSTRLCSSCDR